MLKSVYLNINNSFIMIKIYINKTLHHYKYTVYSMFVFRLTKYFRA